MLYVVDDGSERRLPIFVTCADDPALVAQARERYLAIHAEAAGYIGFGDFALWRLEVEALRYVGGFGRMSWVDPSAYVQG
jgi:hypothetical protein